MVFVGATIVTEWIGAGAAIAAVVGATVTIVQARRVQRLNAAFTWIDKLASAELREIQLAAGGFFRCLLAPDVPPADWPELPALARADRQWAYWEQLLASSEQADRETAMKIVALPNLLEDLAGMYNRNVLDRQTVRLHAGGYVKQFWLTAEWWLARYRADPRSNAYQDLFKMREHMLLHDKRPRWHRPNAGRIARGWL